MRFAHPRSLATRLTLGAAFWCAFLLLLGGALLSNLYGSTVERSFDDRLAVLLDSLIAASEYQPAAGLRIDRPLPDPRFERVYSGWYWQIRAPDGNVLRSRSLWDSELPWPPAGADPEPLEPSVQSATGPDADALRALTRSVRLPGESGRFRFLVAGATAEIAAVRKRFDRVLMLSLGGLGLGLLIALLVQVRYGLEPLRAVSRSLTAIRTGKGERLEGSFPTEIQPLARELNALLEQNARVVERARTHVGNLAHGLKTPLSVLRNAAAELEGEEARAIEDQVALMQRQIDHYLIRARTAGPVGLSLGRTPVMAVVDDLGRTLGKLYRERGIQFSASGAAQMLFAGDRQDLEELLGNLLDNAFKWARSAVVLEVTSATLTAAGAAGTAGRLEIRIEDDGPGLDPAARSEVLQRGKRLDESTPGTGLGLDIVRDIAELYGGELRLEDAALGGLRVRLSLPAVDD